MIYCYEYLSYSGDVLLKGWPLFRDFVGNNVKFEPLPKPPHYIRVWNELAVVYLFRSSISLLSLLANHTYTYTLTNGWFMQIFVYLVFDDLNLFVGIIRWVLSVCIIRRIAKETDLFGTELSGAVIVIVVSVGIVLAIAFFYSVLHSRLSLFFISAPRGAHLCRAYILWSVYMLFSNIRVLIWYTLF